MGQQSSCRNGELAGRNSLNLLLDGSQPHNTATKELPRKGVPPQSSTQAQSLPPLQLHTALPMASSLAAWGRSLSALGAAACGSQSKQVSEGRRCCAAKLMKLCAKRLQMPCTKSPLELASFTLMHHPTRQLHVGVKA